MVGGGGGGGQKGREGPGEAEGGKTSPESEEVGGGRKGAALH